MAQPTSAEVLRRAAVRPDAPRRLIRVADAVLDGKFSWEDVAGGGCEHPLAQALFTPKARETLWPLLERTAAGLADSEPAGQPAQSAVPEHGDDDEYYRTFHVLRDDSGLPSAKW